MQLIIAQTTRIVPFLLPEIQMPKYLDQHEWKYMTIKQIALSLKSQSQMHLIISLALKALRKNETSQTLALHKSQSVRSILQLQSK